MVPVLSGRIQTRIFLLGVIGSLWTLAITPLLPPTSAPLSDRYKATFTVLAVVLVVGLAWECLYHFLQQFRWEKDWPAFFGLLTGINEGIVAWIIVRGHALTWRPGEITMIVGMTAIMLIVLNGIILGKPGSPDSEISLQIGWFVGLIGAAGIGFGGVLRQAELARGRKPPGVL